MGELSAWHWLIVAAVALVLFGSKRLPDAARSLGRSLRIFKSEVGGLRAGEETSPPDMAAAPQRSVDVTTVPAGHSPLGIGVVGASAETASARSGEDGR
ncbi:Sec-independent protein translocase subunit TatA [Actinoallomurus soli]|uniref:Sec-independent protein translocase subunit TatA n=1 Tax=Actinoallomurus soli TaxID=2952535 RepID=UPI002093099C|nr:Sec-independent protein translocase subunit TatA [Actinoallomurus soli]MCO5973585.1 Sec-independent protein translocase subunit TatA [Actinoallomurus soli]